MDLIERQKAIGALDAKFNITGRENAETIRDYINGVDKKLRELPSAERRGRWIRTGEDGYCSICNCDMPIYKEDWEWRYLETPYCPNCGARMEGEEE